MGPLMREPMRYVQRVGCAYLCLPRRVKTGATGRLSPASASAPPRGERRRAVRPRLTGARAPNGVHVGQALAWKNLALQYLFVELCGLWGWVDSELIF